MSQPLINIEALFGWAELETRFRLVGDRMIGEGRRTDYDRRGNVTRITEWEPTGVEVTWSAAVAPPPAPWWKFWRRST